MLLLLMLWLLINSYCIVVAYTVQALRAYSHWSTVITLRPSL